MLGAMTVIVGAAGLALPAPQARPRPPLPVTKASTSTRGVTSTAINVVFPVVNLQALSSEIGFAGDVEYTEQAKAIKLFVGQINESGGINGRKINPIISYFDPTDESNMRALCKDWTEGSPAAFAVLDGVGDWSGDNELCIAQEGHTPFLGQWTTVSNWTRQGSPYLWWTGPDDASILQAVVQWGHSSGLLGGTRKVGIIAGDRASDQLALNQYLLPDLKRIGVQPVVETIAAETSETAATNSDASLDVEKLRAAGVDSLIPLMPFNAFLPVLGAETQQQYFPKLLLSDYEDSIETSLGLLPVPFQKALNGQEGVTTETLGGIDDARSAGPGRVRPRGARLLGHLAQGLSRDPQGEHERLHRGAGTGAGVVPGDPALRRGGYQGGQGSQSPDLRRSDVDHQELPRRLFAPPHLRPGQVLRPLRVPGGEPAREQTTLGAVPDAAGPAAAAGRLLASGAELEAPPQERMSTAFPSEKAQWEEDGWSILPGVFSDEELRAAQAALPELFPTAEEFAQDVDPDRNRPFRVDSHSVMPTFPFESSALNRLVLHEDVISLAQEFLELEDIRLYQGMLSAKYGEGAPEDEQLLHVDYGNHTLVVPRPEVGYQHLELFIYLSDVTTETAATRMVSRRLTRGIPVERTYLSPADYHDLYEAEVPAAGPAGSILAYRPDVYHRGVRMTAPGAARFMLHVSFKPVATDWLGSQAWPSAAEGLAWHRFMQTPTAGQLAVLGFPEPGHPYWTEDTLRGVAARYPLLDMTPWRRAFTGAEAGAERSEHRA